LHIGKLPTHILGAQQPDVTASLTTPSKQSGVAPYTVHFTGTITASSPCTVAYCFIRSDGSHGSSAPHLWTFRQAGVKDVSDSWVLSANYSGWEQICITSKNIKSNKAEFTYTATKKKPNITHNVKGTTQLSGENAQFGTTYTLGNAYPFNITIRSAEYSVEPVLIGDRLYTVKNDEKFLILHMIYHNPQHSDRFVRWDSFGFTAVDVHDQNHDGLLDLGAETDNTSVSMNLKPAQKKDVYAAMIVPAAGEIPKLMIKSGDQQVLRYNLIGNVKGLPEVYADTTDKSGATALSKINAVPGTSYSVGVFSFKLNKAGYADISKLGDAKASEGEKLYVINFTLKNMSKGNAFFRWDSFQRKLTDADGVGIGDCLDVFQASKDRSFGDNLLPAQELTLRYVFNVPADNAPKTFTVGTGIGRTFVFDISGA